ATLLRQRSRLRTSGVNRVEQQLVSAVRLSPKHCLNAQQIQLALAHARFGSRYCALEITLPPSPAATQRRRVREPSDRLNALGCGIGCDPEHRTGLEEDVCQRAHSVRHPAGIVPTTPQHAARCQLHAARRRRETPARRTGSPNCPHRELPGTPPQTETRTARKSSGSSPMSWSRRTGPTTRSGLASILWRHRTGA